MHLRRFMRPISALLAALLLLAPPATQLAAAAEVASEARASEEVATGVPEPVLASEAAPRPAWWRIAAGFLVTSGIKYALGGLGPARLLPMLGSLGPATGMASLIGIGLLEAGVSISLFQLISGIRTNDRQFLAFLLAAGVTAALSPLITTAMGPIAATLLTNAGRLLLFNLIAREEHEPLSSVLGVGGVSVPDLLLGQGGPEARVVPKDTGKLDGDLAALHAEVQRRYSAMVDEPSLGATELADYTTAKRSLDEALAAATR
jgi:hypothetical protein